MIYAVITTYYDDYGRAHIDISEVSLWGLIRHILKVRKYASTIKITIKR